MKHYDVAIIGGGVSGTALLHVLTRYTDIKNIGLFEKHAELAQVASHHTQNSQTLHYGDIETNYTYEKAKSVSAGARLVEHYLTRHAPEDDIYDKQHKMVIAVGEQEVAALRERYEEFQDLFPKLHLIEQEEIGTLEPNVMKGRDPDEEVIALLSPNGYIMDYHALAKSFYEQAKDHADVHLAAPVKNIKEHDNHFTFSANNKEYSCDMLIVNAGAMSARIAKDLGYGKHLGILSVAGNFYKSKKPLLNGKVYTMQLEKLPFAAPHGDPDVRDKSYTRFGPSAKPLLLLERWDYHTITDYFTAGVWNYNGFATLFTILFDRIYFPYMLKNILYDVPVLGTRLFARNVYKIIPTLKASDITKDRGYGGARPQIINTKKRTIDMGEARLEENRVIFNITPSPGASTCLANAKRDTEIIVKKLGKQFDTKKFNEELR